MIAGAATSRHPIDPLGATLACVLAVVQVVLLAQVAWDKSDTADETRYVAAAASLWAHGEHRDLCEAPALPKRAFGLALRLTEPALPETPLGWQRAAATWITGQPAERLRRLFFTARCATIAAVAVAGLLVFATASRFGRAAAIVSHALWCFSPTLLANGSLATLDAWAAALMAVVLWASARLVERVSVARVLVVGIACGGAAATKVTTLLFVPLICAVLVQSTRSYRGAARARRVIARIALLWSGLLISLWAVYGGSVGGVDLREPCPYSIEQLAPLAGWLPFPAWIEGVVFQLRHGGSGHPSYLFGEVRSDGWWWFYLACIALKVPLGTQALALVGGAAALLSPKRPPPTLRTDAALLGYPLILLAAMSAGRHQANIAFLLPASPFVCVWLGAAASRAIVVLGSTGKGLVAALVLLSIGETLRVHPHHLMFFNLWAGGPSHGPRYLVHREDWGQDKRRLAEWQREHGIERLYYAAYGPNAEEWGIVYDPVPCTPKPGVYALHAVEVHRPQFSLRPGCVDWLTVEPPDERLGYSIYIYLVDAARLARLIEKRAEPPFWMRGDDP